MPYPPREIKLRYDDSTSTHIRYGEDRSPRPPEIDSKILQEESSHHPGTSSPPQPLVPAGDLELFFPLIPGTGSIRGRRNGWIRLIPSLLPEATSIPLIASIYKIPLLPAQGKQGNHEVEESFLIPLPPLIVTKPSSLDTVLRSSYRGRDISFPPFFFFFIHGLCIPTVNVCDP